MRNYLQLFNFYSYMYVLISIGLILFHLSLHKKYVIIVLHYYTAS